MTPRKEQRRDTKLDWALAGLAAFVAVALYLNTLHGAFVYDDVKQIVSNPLIQDTKLFSRAVLSDVWAFKGGAGTAASSNYWRPTFVLWLIAHVRLFGLDDTTAWHATNIALHALATVLAFFLLRRLGMASYLAGTVALLFAAHPVHVESVAWISGSPDLILAVCLLGSLGFVSSLGERPAAWKWAAAIALYAVAQGAKEVAIFFPLIVFVMLSETGARKAAMTAAPFLGLGIVYFLARAAILGQVSKNVEGGAGIMGTILTAPAVFTFYLRQVVFPYWVGPSYPIRPVTFASLGLLNFGLPLLVSLGAGFLMFWSARRSFHARLGAVLFVLMLAPAMNIGAFIPEQLVHDRYLYLPLLGALMILMEAGRGLSGARVYAAGALLCIPFGLQTLRYNRTWTDELALWQAATQSDATSAFNQMQLGFELKQRKRLPEALRAFERADAIHPITNTAGGRGDVLTALGRYDEAEQVLRAGLARAEGQAPVLRRQLVERLAVCYERQRRPEDAAAVLVQGRATLPEFHALLTTQLAVVLYQSGRKAEALRELEAARDHARTEILPSSKELFYRLGLLYSEAGRSAEARAALTEFLATTASLNVSEESGRGILEHIALERRDAENRLRSTQP